MNLDEYLELDYPIDVFGLEHEIGDGFIAIYADFPQVKGDGDTPEEAMESAKASLREYLIRCIEADREIPMPRTNTVHPFGSIA